jgi:hypothetical protein
MMLAMADADDASFTSLPCLVADRRTYRTPLDVFLDIVSTSPVTVMDL